MKYHPVVIELEAMILENGWTDDFNQAIERARSFNIPQLEDIHNLEDYLQWMNDFLSWVPCENHSGREVYNRLCKFYFILDDFIHI